MPCTSSVTARSFDNPSQSSTHQPLGSCDGPLFKVLSLILRRFCCIVGPGKIAQTRLSIRVLDSQLVSATYQGFIDEPRSHYYVGRLSPTKHAKNIFIRPYDLSSVRLLFECFASFLVAKHSDTFSNVCTAANTTTLAGP